MRKKQTQGGFPHDLKLISAHFSGIKMSFVQISERIIGSINLKTFLRERIFAKESITRASVKFSWHTFHWPISRIIFDLTFTRSSFRLIVCRHWSNINIVYKLCDFDWYR